MRRILALALMTMLPAGCSPADPQAARLTYPKATTGQVVDDYALLHDRLEYLYGMFGEDRVIFGTDYPNSYGVATISEEVGLMKKFFATKTRAQAEKYFWRNAAHVYKFVKRAPDQPGLTG